MDYKELVSWAFQGLLAMGSMLIVQALKDIKISVMLLNERVATVIEKTSWHEKELEKHDGRIRQLEVPNNQWER